MKESPLFVKTGEFVKYVLPVTAKFSKTRRHSLTNRLENGCLRFHELLVRSVKSSGPARIRWLQRADVQLECLRFQFRLAMEIRELSVKRYGAVASHIDELGKLLGAWLGKENTVERRVGDIGERSV